MQTSRLTSQVHHMHLLCLSVGRGGKQNKTKQNIETSLINILVLLIGFMSSWHLVPLGFIAHLLRKTVFSEIIHFTFL